MKMKPEQFLLMTKESPSNIEKGIDAPMEPTSQAKIDKDILDISYIKDSMNNSCSGFSSL